MAREQSVLHTRHKYHRELQPFGTVHCHKGHLAGFIVIFICIAVRRHSFQELFQRSLFTGRCLLILKIVDKRFEIQQVFYSALSLNGVFIFQCFHISRLYKQIVVNIRNSQVFLFLLTKLHYIHHFLY